ncbi:signal peptidase I [Nonomuraea insulae]|uniref:Signal peptidase I n=1 Tax=Nonomuraea insulae TaxID=1616787 RepID=A0ABW1D1U1_9ACTN
MIRVRVAAVALVLLSVLTATAGCGLLSAAVGESTLSMSSESMKPTIQPGTRFMVRRIDDGYVPRLGEIVTFRTPNGWSGTTPDSLYVSRVIGVPGSTVMCCDSQGRLQVDGKALDEPYLAAPPASHMRFDIKVPPNRLWV